MTSKNTAEDARFFSNVSVLQSGQDLQPATYDLIILPGYGFVGDNWELSGHVKQRTSLAAALYQKGVAPKIACSGRWSIMWERKGIIPPVSEARKMQQLLVSSGVPADAIIIEEESMDSIGNAYFLKRDVIRPNNYRKSLVLIADYIVNRAQWCYAKMFEDTYHIDLLPTETPYIHDRAILSAQAEMSKREQLFLAMMQKGDDAFWAKQGYNHPHYQEPRPALVDKVGLGGDK